MTICQDAIAVYGGRDYASKEYFWFNVLFPVFFALYGLGGFVVFTHYGKRYIMLKRRSKTVIAITTIASIISGFHVHLRDAVGPRNFPCVLNGFLFWLSVPFIAGPSILQLLKLRMNVLLEKQRVEKQRGSADAAMAYARKANPLQLIYHFLRGTPDLGHSIYFSHVYYPFCLFVLSMPFAVAFFVTLGVDERWLNNCTGCETSTAEAAFFIASVFVLGAVGFYLCYGLYKTSDPLLLVQEYIVGFMFAGVFGPLSMFLLIFDPNGINYQQRILDWKVCLAIFCTILLTNQTYAQVLIARAQRFRFLNDKHVTSREKLEEIYGDTELKQAFKNHLVCELSIENFFFYEAINEFRAIGSSNNKERLKEKAKDIVERFIMPGGDDEINVGSHHRNRLLDKYSTGEIDLNMFDECWNEIVAILVKDSLPRFLHDPKGFVKKNRQSRAGALVVPTNNNNNNNSV